MSIQNRNEESHGPRQKWVGLARVQPKPGNDALGTARGAFVASIAWAQCAKDYAARVTRALNDYGFDVLEIEDIELMNERVLKHSLAPDVLEVARHVTEANPVAFGAFHSYMV